MEAAAGTSAVAVVHPLLGKYTLSCEGDVPLLFTENETNHERLFGQKNENAHVKDGINNCVVQGKQVTAQQEPVEVPRRRGDKQHQRLMLQNALKKFVVALHSAIVEFLDAPVLDSGEIHPRLQGAIGISSGQKQRKAPMPVRRARGHRQVKLIEAV